MKPRPFGLAVPRYEEAGVPGPYFGDRVWGHLRHLEQRSHRAQFELVPIHVRPFPDGSEKVVIGKNVREKVVFVVHPPQMPPARHVLIAAEIGDALRRSDAKEVYLIEMFNSYYRQDSRADREPITARLVADLYSASGIDGVFLADPHSKQLAGFHRKLEPLPMWRRLSKAVRRLCDLNNAVVVVPDHGGYQRAETMANLLRLPLAVIHKQRTGNETEVKAVLGDISGRDCLIVDDIIGTGTTLLNDARALRDRGASRVWGVATHLGLYADSRRRLREAEIRVIGTNSLPIALAEEDRGHIDAVDVSDIIAHVIRRKSQRGSLRQYFQT